MDERDHKAMNEELNPPLLLGAVMSSVLCFLGFHKYKIYKEQNGNFAKPVLAAGFIPVEQLPTASMGVKWICEDGVEDVGFYYHPQKEFAGWDLCSEKPITHWKPSEHV